MNRAFPSTELDVLLPGWGLRPGDVTQAVDAHLSAEAVAALGDSLSAAIDWARQVDALGRSRLPVVLTTTWLDAPSYGTAPRDLAPVEYLVQLAAPWSLPVTGENTGGSSSAALHRIVDLAARLGLTRVTWMSAASLAVGPVTLTELAAAADLAWPGSSRTPGAARGGRAAAPADQGCCYDAMTLPSAPGHRVGHGRGP